MDSNITPASTTVMLSIALAGVLYGLYKVFEAQEISFFINEVQVGPYTPDSDPLIFWIAVVLQVMIALGIVIYLWMDWDPPHSEETPFSHGNSSDSDS